MSCFWRARRAGRRRPLASASGTSSTSAGRGNTRRSPTRARAPPARRRAAGRAARPAARGSSGGAGVGQVAGRHPAPVVPARTTLVDEHRDELLHEQRVAGGRLGDPSCTPASSVRSVEEVGDEAALVSRERLQLDRRAALAQSRSARGGRAGAAQTRSSGASWSAERDARSGRGASPRPSGCPRRRPPRPPAAAVSSSFRAPQKSSSSGNGAVDRPTAAATRAAIASRRGPARDARPRRPAGPRRRSRPPGGPSRQRPERDPSPVREAAAARSVVPAPTRAKLLDQPRLADARVAEHVEAAASRGPRHRAPRGAGRAPRRVRRSGRRTRASAPAP